MPLYDFQCFSCGAKIEALTRMDDKDRAYCPHCFNRLITVISCRGFTPFRLAGWWDNLDIRPVYIKDKAHLKRVCKETGAYSQYLDG